MPLPAAFYARDPTDVAHDVLGKVLVVRSPRGVTSGRIVEAEAYRGPEDRAAHSFGGRCTARTAAMFGPPGRAYVFMIYGMHFHFNLVTSTEGAPHAVLIRAVEPLAGWELMSVRRGVASGRPDLTNGPGKLCQALAIDRADYGADLCDPTGRIFLTEGPPPAKVRTSPRIGIDYAGSWAERPWRFFDPDSAYVSKVRGAGRPS